LLQLQSNQLRWLPIELDRLPATTDVRVRSVPCLRVLPSDSLSQLHYNPLPLSFGDYENARPRLTELAAATTHIAMIRERATTVCIALQELNFPALVTLKILDALFPPNSIRMWAKWELITAVKHFHQRHNTQ
jgi:hypothetical protein